MDGFSWRLVGKASLPYVKNKVGSLLQIIHNGELQNHKGINTKGKIIKLIETPE